MEFRLNDDCSKSQAEIFAILKAIEAIAGGPTSDSVSYMIFVDSQAALGATVSSRVKNFWTGPYPSMLGSGS